MKKLSFAMEENNIIFDRFVSNMIQKKVWLKAKNQKETFEFGGGLYIKFIRNFFWKEKLLAT